MTNIYTQTFNRWSVHFYTVYIVKCTLQSTKKYAFSLLMFIFEPACKQKLFIVSIPCMSDSMFFNIIVRSSACCTLLISLSIFGSENPCILIFSLIFIASISDTRIYSRAETGQAPHLEIIRCYEYLWYPQNILSVNQCRNNAFWHWIWCFWKTHNV